MTDSGNQIMKYNMDKCHITDFSRLCNDEHFSSQDDMRDYIINNKEAFCSEVLGVEYKDHTIDFRFPIITYLHNANTVVPLVFTDQNNQLHFIDLKNPKNKLQELGHGLTRCMSYYYLARVRGYNLADVYLVTSKHSNIIPLIIRDSQVNVNYIYFDKEKWAIANI